MNIKILGTGCSKCEKLFNNVQEALNETDIEQAEVIKVTSINEIMS
ncbi:thioredoxin family protein, partial [bacterium]